jgi:hypothetical protein
MKISQTIDIGAAQVTTPVHRLDTKPAMEAPSSRKSCFGELSEDGMGSLRDSAQESGLTNPQFTLVSPTTQAETASVDGTR